MAVSTNLVNVGSRLCRRLDVWNGPLAGARLGLIHRYLALRIEVSLVADEDERYAIVALHSQYVIPEASNRRPNNAVQVCYYRRDNVERPLAISNQRLLHRPRVHA